jgi:flagellar hook-associated protein 2
MTTANVLTSLGAADLDTKQLVTDLVNAVKEPRQKQIDTNKEKAGVAISSLGLLKSALSNLQAAATELGSVGKLNKLSISNSNSGVVVAEAGSSAVALPGNHSIKVTTLAQPKRVASAGFASSSTAPSSTAFDITIKKNDGSVDKVVQIAANTSVAGIVSAINASGSSVKATLVNTGTDYKIVLEGASGASNSFSVDTGATSQTPASALTFATGLQTAQDAVFTINDIPMTRSSNVITDALDGVTLKLNSTSATAVQLGVSFDSTDIAASAKNFVAAYNTLMEFIGISTGPAIEDNDLSATLKGDTSIRGIKNTLRAKLTARSTGASGNATHWSVLGVSLDRAGVLQFDEAKFKSSFESNPTDVVKALSNNASEPYLYSGAASGLAGDMAIAVFGLVRSTGTIADVEKSYQNKLSRIETEQTKLDKQIEAITARYERQFSALNAVLAEFKATSKRLDSTFNRDNNN